MLKALIMLGEECYQDKTENIDIMERVMFMIYIYLSRRRIMLLTVMMMMMVLATEFY